MPILIGQEENTMRGCRKVLIAMNGCKEVLTQGIKLAQEEKSWITVVKVIQCDLNLTGVKNMHDMLYDGGTAALAEIEESAEAEGALIKTKLEQGDVPERIVAAAVEEKCDLIIMGSKKKKGMLSRIFGDHVVEKVIDRAPCPVFVVGI